MKPSHLFIALTAIALTSCASEAPHAQLRPAPSAASASPPASAPVAAPASRSSSARAPVSTPAPLSEPSQTPAPSPAPPIPLFRRFPALAARLPYLAFGGLPTPIERAGALGASVGAANLYIKRDDLSGPEYGGNKTRKLEFFLADAVQKQKKTVVTSGAAGSNHALATAIYAKKLGLRAVLLLMPQPPSDLVRQRLLADQVASAELRLARSQAEIERIERALARAGAPDDEPYIIAAGGSSPLGDVGYVNAAFELAEQIAQGQMPEPDRIYIALGTMGSAVGLRIGLMAAGLRSRLFAVRAATYEAASASKMSEMFKNTTAFLRSLDPSFPALALQPGDADIIDGYLGPGYAVPTPKGDAAVRIFKQFAGIDLEPTYTGKTLAALIDAAPGLDPGAVVLFWNTYNSRPLDLRGADPSALPAPFQAYFRPAPAPRP